MRDQWSCFSRPHESHTPQFSRSLLTQVVQIRAPPSSVRAGEHELEHLSQGTIRDFTLHRSHTRVPSSRAVRGETLLHFPHFSGGSSAPADLRASRTLPNAALPRCGSWRRLWWLNSSSSLARSMALGGTIVSSALRLRSYNRRSAFAEVIPSTSFMRSSVAVLESRYQQTRHTWRPATSARRSPLRWQRSQLISNRFIRGAHPLKSFLSRKTGHGDIFPSASRERISSHCASLANRHLPRASFGDLPRRSSPVPGEPLSAPRQGHFRHPSFISLSRPLLDLRRTLTLLDGKDDN